MLRDRLAAEINRRTAKAPPRHFSETLNRSTTTKLIAGLSASSGLAR